MHAPFAARSGQATSVTTRSRGAVPPPAGPYPATSPRHSGPGAAPDRTENVRTDWRVPRADGFVGWVVAGLSVVIEIFVTLSA